MRLIRHIFACALLLACTNLSAANNPPDESVESLGEYLKNLGAYLGFDITTAPENDPIASLLDASATTLAQQYAFVTSLGSIPVNTFSDALSYFVPSDTSNYSALNDMANYTFAKQPNAEGYDSTSTSDAGGISVTALIDQETYQKDPVTQAAQNIIMTPSTTFCMNNDATEWKDNCDYLYDTKVMANVVGTLPSTEQFFSYDYNQNIIPQLTANTLISPLMYTTSDNSSSTSSSDAANSGSKSEDGLVAQNQAQNAANFIRYATGIVSPAALPKRSDYDDTYSKAISDDTSVVSAFDKQIAQESIAKYLTKLRVYAAQLSVGTGNLYFILSKRMPQANEDGSTKSSQALSEFQMATRRLYDPSKQDQGTQWVDQINNASSATVQKEMAILLSEINYQLYLSRQIEERILATLSILGSGALHAPDFASDSKIDTQPASTQDA